MRIIKVRPLTFQEVAELKRGDRFYVADSHYDEGSVVVPATLYTPIHDDQRRLLEKGVPGGFSVPTVYIQTEYRIEYSVYANKIYTEDLDGTPVNVVETVGTQVGLTVYAPGMEGPDVLDRIHAALRSEFGVGVLQLRKQHHQPVCETGLPVVLGVPIGEIPKLI